MSEREKLMFFGLSQEVIRLNKCSSYIDPSTDDIYMLCRGGRGMRWIVAFDEMSLGIYIFVWEGQEKSGSSNFLLGYRYETEIPLDDNRQLSSCS